MPLPSERASALSELWRAQTNMFLIGKGKPIVDKDGTSLTPGDIRSQYVDAYRRAWKLGQPGEVEELLIKNQRRLEGTTFIPGTSAHRKVTSF